MNKAPVDTGILILAVLAVLIPVLFFIYNIINEAFWDRGKIPPFYFHSRANEMEIIIALAGLIIRKDFRDITEKKQFLHEYFARHFAQENYNFIDSLQESYKNPLKIEEIAKWFNKNNLSFQNKLNIVQLMIDMSVIDGELNGHEYDAIKYFHTLLKLPIVEFDRMMHIHMQQEERRRERERKQANTQSNYRRESAKSLACKILGVNITDSADVIKKAYRQLVKEHHPDKFSNGTEIQKKMAHERFLEIQKAYEILEN